MKELEQIDIEEAIANANKEAKESVSIYKSMEVKEIEDAITYGGYPLYKNTTLLPPFDSSCYGKIGYNPLTEVLTVGFINKDKQLKDIYTYGFVPASFAIGLNRKILNKEEKIGSWLRKELKNFGYRRMDESLWG